MLSSTPTPPTARAVSEVLEELAARCEAASGPDRDLFRDAFDARFPRPTPIRKPGFEKIGDGLGPYTDDYRAYGDRQGRFNALLSAEAWLDAAMMLVPDDLRVALVQKPDATWGCALLALSGDNRDCPESDGALAALALTAAALRSAATLARETEAGS